MLACLYHLQELFNAIHLCGFVGWMDYLVKICGVYLSN